MTGRAPSGQALVSDQARAGLDPSGFDPSRIAEFIAGKLGRAQMRVIMSLSDQWGAATCHKTARRMFYGVTARRYTVVQHKHCTDNCWRLSDLGMAVREQLKTRVCGHLDPRCVDDPCPAGIRWLCKSPAIAIEARSDTTGTGVAVGESADPKGIAQ